MLNNKIAQMTKIMRIPNLLLQLCRFRAVHFPFFRACLKKTSFPEQRYYHFR